MLSKIGYCYKKYTNQLYKKNIMSQDGKDKVNSTVTLK